MSPSAQRAGEVRGRGERLLFPDLLRCLAIYLVVGLHTLGGVIVKGSLLETSLWNVCNVMNLLGRMGVPLFFMLSGFLLLSDPRTADPLPFYRRRLRRLLVPFLFWDAVCFVLRGLMEEGRGFGLKLFLTELVQQGSDYHLWFIYQIAALYLLAPFLRMIVERAERKALWVLLGVVLFVPSVLRLVNILQPFLWFSPFRAPIEGYAGFFLLGYLLGTGEYAPRTRRILYGLGVLALAAAALGNRFLSGPEHMNLYFNEGYALNHYFTAGACFLLLRYVPLPREGRLAAVAKGLAGIAFGVYFCHVPLLRAYASLLPRWGIPADTFLYLLCLFLLTALSATLAAWIFSRLPVLKKLV